MKTISLNRSITYTASQNATFEWASDSLPLMHLPVARFPLFSPLLLPNLAFTLLRMSKKRGKKKGGRKEVDYFFRIQVLIDLVCRAPAFAMRFV